MSLRGQFVTYSQVDLCSGEREIAEARNDNSLAIGQLLSDVGAKASPDRPEGLLVETTSHFGLHCFLDQCYALGSIQDITINWTAYPDFHLCISFILTLNFLMQVDAVNHFLRHASTLFLTSLT